MEALPWEPEFILYEFDGEADLDQVRLIIIRYSTMNVQRDLTKSNKYCHE